MTKTIPYNTYGTVTTRASVTIPASNVPYTYSPLKSDLYIASDLTNVAPKPVIANMYQYAQRNIPNYSNITSIPSGHLPTDINTSTAQDWQSAFSGCNNLTVLPDPFYDTSNATNMYGMFLFCKNLTTMPNFDTSKVTNMYWMFSGCSNLTTVPNFDTSNVTNMSYMLSSCTNLTTVPNFDTSNVTDMCRMFYQSFNLTTIPNFNTSKVTNMSRMFYSGGLIAIPNIDTSNVTDMADMFSSCSDLTTVPNFDTSKVTDMSSMFQFCRNLTTIPIFNFNSVTNMNNMFRWCQNIRGNLYLESNNISAATNLFANCTAYTKNIYCHANTTTYNTIYNAMGNNTYNSNWNAYLKTFGSEPIPLLKIADAFTEENGKQDTVNYVFRTPLSNISFYIESTNGYEVLITDIVNVTPYQDLNISVQFNIPSRIPSVSDDPDPVLVPFDLKIINRDTNEEIYNSSNDNFRYTIYDVNYYLGI